MLYLLLKAVISGVLVAAVSEIARRYPGWGGLVASLPLVSLLALTWLYVDTRETAKVADLAQSTFWFFLPSMPMFLALPAMLRAGVNFWAAFSISVVGTACLYLLMFWLAPRVGIRL